MEPQLTTSINQRWSMDFVSDTLGCGRRFRALAIVDCHSRECLALEVDSSLSGERVVRVLERLKEARGLPAVIQTDNGPEFQVGLPSQSSSALCLWSVLEDRSDVCLVRSEGESALQLLL